MACNCKKKKVSVNTNTNSVPNNVPSTHSMETNNEIKEILIKDEKEDK